MNSQSAGTNTVDPNRATDHSPALPESAKPLMKRSDHRFRPTGRLVGGGAGPGRDLTGRSARKLVTGLLGRMGRDRLTIIDADGQRHRFGPDTTEAGALEATITIHDDRAWSSLLMEGSIGLGRGYIEGWWYTDEPVVVVRIAARNVGGLDELRNRLNRLTGRVGDAARRALPRSSRRRNREEIGAHYDLGNDFFELFLDETMTYSSAVFADGVDLQAGSEAKYDRLLAKLGVAADHSVLEIGTGWGGFAIRAAQQTGARVTTTTISSEQFDEAQTRVKAAGLDDTIELLQQDWRDLEGRHDRVVSIEMIEAVDWRDYDRFFSTIERCLAPDGMVGLQAICVPDRRYGRTKNTEDFIRRFVFPGGFLPSIGSIVGSVANSTRLQLLDVEDFGAHYAETLRQWRNRFDGRLDDVKALGLDDRFCRLWRFYLAYCEAAFRERHCTVNQLVLVGPDWRPDGLALRPL
jgi:cyclopropane-fatty-acyl-phospholipid synthase